MIPDSLISLGYLKEQVILHASPRGYGGKGGKWAPTAAALAREYGALSVLDYGTGQGHLAMALRCAPLGLDVREYDPAIVGKDILPDPADLVVCTDVLEHVERDRLPAVLAHLRSLCLKAAFLVVALDPANKVLTDGRNAHLIQESPCWWEAQVTAAGFTVLPQSRLTGLPFPVAYGIPEKREKRWIAVVLP
jgi:hypothetical protein